MATTPLLHESGAAPDLIQAGKWEVQIQTGGTDEAPTYSFIYGLTDFSPKPDISTEDATDIYDDGWKREVGVAGAYNIDVTGNVRGNDEGDEFTQDPGQAALIAAAEDFGVTVKLRWWRRDGIDLAYEADVISKVTMDGGKPGSLQKFSGQILVQGKPTSITKPVVTTP